MFNHIRPCTCIEMVWAAARRAGRERARRVVISWMQMLTAPPTTADTNLKFKRLYKNPIRGAGGGLLTALPTEDKNIK